MVKLLLAGLLGWTAAVVVLILFVPGHVNTPGCARHIDVSAACQAQMATENADILAFHTLPLLAVIAGGYLMVAIVAFWQSRRARPLRS